MRSRIFIKGIGQLRLSFFEVILEKADRETHNIPGSSIGHLPKGKPLGLELTFFVVDFGVVWLVGMMRSDELIDLTK